MRIARHPLEREASRMMTICRRIGLRLNRWFRDMPLEQAAQYAIRIPGELPVIAPRLDAEGNPIMEPVVPDRDMMEAFRWYQSAVLGLLKEQRARAAMKHGRPEITDAEMEAELRELAADTVRTMPQAELDALLSERNAINVPSKIAHPAGSESPGPPAGVSEGRNPSEGNPLSSDMLTFGDDE